MKARGKERPRLQWVHSENRVDFTPYGKVSHSQKDVTQSWTKQGDHWGENVTLPDSCDWRCPVPGLLGNIHVRPAVEMVPERHHPVWAGVARGHRPVSPGDRADTASGRALPGILRPDSLVNTAPFAELPGHESHTLCGSNC